jgi:hypothetical protein
MGDGGRNAKGKREERKKAGNALEEKRNPKKT